MNYSGIDLLAQTERGVGEPLLWSLILIIIILILFGAVGMYRKWMRSDDTGSGEGFTLSDLRKLHKAGQMTDEEFEKAKKVLIGSVKATAEKRGQNPAPGQRSDLKDPKQGPRTIPPRFDADSPEK